MLRLGRRGGCLPGNPRGRRARLSGPSFGAFEYGRYRCRRVRQRLGRRGKGRGRRRGWSAGGGGRRRGGPTAPGASWRNVSGHPHVSTDGAPITGAQACTDHAVSATAATAVPKPGSEKAIVIRSRHVGLSRQTERLKRRLGSRFAFGGS